MQRSFKITRRHESGNESVTDQVAVEEPLQIVVDGHSVAVTMRTPGHDEELVTGFLMTEGIITSMKEIRKIDCEARDNHALVFLDDEKRLDLSKLSRHIFTTSSCGLCGKTTIQAVMQNHPPIQKPKKFSETVVLSTPKKMRQAQATFSQTGGLHAAGVFDSSGRLIVIREDVGRHNALDKIIGHAVQSAFDLSECFLLVSGRVSLEIMQKSLAARFPLVCAISAPSSLVIDFANESGQALIGFLRPPTFNLYTGTLG